MKKTNRLFILISLLVFLGGAYVLRASWLPWVAQALVVNEKPEHADLIVVLNGSNTKKRMDHAVNLYRQGYAKKILVSGSWELEEETGIHLAKVYLQKQGVLEEDILLENESRSTRENALYVARFMEDHHFRSFILVTSPAHSFRARYYFKKSIPSSVRWISSSNIDDLDIHSWWKSVEVCREVFYEYLTMLLSLMGQIG